MVLAMAYLKPIGKNTPEMEEFRPQKQTLQTFKLSHHGFGQTVAHIGLPSPYSGEEVGQFCLIDALHPRIGIVAMPGGIGHISQAVGQFEEGRIGH